MDLEPTVSDFDARTEKAPSRHLRPTPRPKAARQPNSRRKRDFVKLFQQVISGLPEQIALVDEDWVILAVNEAWTQSIADHGYVELSPGENYFEFCDSKAKEGHAAAAVAANGVRQIDAEATRSFRYVYHGNDRWEGHAFQLCINRLNVDGHVFATITRYDVTELVQLRLMREDFSQSLIEGQAVERRRMAREVHDSTMQLVAGVGLSLTQLRRSRHQKARDGIVDEMQDLIGELQQELRTIAYLAHPPEVRELGLPLALRQMTQGLARRTGLQIALHADDKLVLWAAAEAAVFRVIQEALTNVHRHAHATDVIVGLYQRRSILHVVVADNGVGMPRQNGSGVGLSSMRARIAELGGRLSIRSSHPGALLIASIPAHPELRPNLGLSLPGSTTISASSTEADFTQASGAFGHFHCAPVHMISKDEWLAASD
jgi:two-component system, NarL family, sensor kinase